MIIGVGTDIVSIKRLEANYEALAKKILTINEYAIYNEYSINRKIEFLAGRIAAKEAIIKAMKTKYLLSDIEVLLIDNNLCCNLKDFNINISISHEKEYAIAFAVVEQ